MRLFIILGLTLAFSFQIRAQEKKSLQINRTEISPKIDGILEDEIWKDADVAQNFIEFRPTMGQVEKEGQKTLVKMVYDNEAIYIGAYLYDDPELITKQFAGRDDFGQNDFFGFIINPNNDAQNDTEFFVFPTGNQADAISNPSNGEDFGWNAVWESAVKIVEDGWIVEMKIPYSALRFSNQEAPIWGLQFHRHFRSTRQQFTWNPIDVTKGNIGLYHGELIGLKNIQPPTRLSFYPFASALFNTFDGKTEDNFTLGLDLKYGISENFTLDATLIPDFSQAGFDNVELNLGPFEQTFSEQRQFFKEGVDLFNKGDLFYSRRIGGSPSRSVSLNENEEIEGSQKNVKTLNALKISGRTKKGLGVGFFNAITEKTEVTVKNNVTQEKRKVVVEPLSNYNIIVLDQQFNKNSSVSLINTNVTRNGDFRDANVTGLLFDVTNKTNKYNVRGEAKISSLNLVDENRNGFSSSLEISKISGNYQYGIGHNLADKKYDINDLGVIFRNNYNNFSGDFSYRIFEPTKSFNNFNYNIWVNYNRLYDPNTYTGNSMGGRFHAQTKKLLDFGANFNFSLGTQYDYFEPRTEGRYFTYENSLNSNFWVSTNYNKTFALDANVGYFTLFEKERDFYNYWFGLSPRVRFNDKFTISYSINFDDYRNDRGYVSTLNDDIIFGERDRLVLVNSFSGNYNFNTLHGLSLTFRNYWSTVTYDNDLYVLKQNGSLNQEDGYTLADINDPNVNFNTWNLDFGYTWQFAPGSQLSALYRNQLFNSNRESSKKYFESINSLFKQPLQHTFSLRLVYYIDYNNVKKIFKNKNI